MKNLLQKLSKERIQKNKSDKEQYQNHFHICLVVFDLSLGGLERTVIQLANGLVARGLPVRLLSVENKDNALISELRKEVELFCLEGSILSKLLQLRKLTRGHVIHLHFSGGYIRPFYRFVMLGEDPLLNTYHNVYSQMRGFFRTLADRLLNFQLKANVCVSKAVKDYCMEIVGIPESKTHIIYNAVEVNPHPKTLDFKQTDQFLNLISVARLVKQKDHSTLLRGIAAAKQLGCNFHINIVGDGSEKDTLIQLGHDLNVDDLITWYGEIRDREQVKMLLQQADAFVTTSAWEGLPLTVLEAMSEGLLVIASDIMPHREALDQNAVYFPVGDYQSLALAVNSVCRNGDQYRQLALNAYQRVKSLFSMDHAVDAHIRLYQSLLK